MFESRKRAWAFVADGVLAAPLAALVLALVAFGAGQHGRFAQLPVRSPVPDMTKPARDSSRFRI